MTSRYKIPKFLLALVAMILSLEFASWLYLVIIGKTKPKSMKKSLYQPHPYVVYTLLPSIQKEKKEGFHAINSAGYRGPALKKNTDHLRIVCIGASSTYSIRVGNEDTYPRLLEKKLRETYRDDSIEVVNAGVGGYTTAESLANLSTRILDIKPDVLIIYHAVNDVHPRVMPGFQRDYSHYRKSLNIDSDFLDILQHWSGFARLLNHMRPKRKHIRHLTTHIDFKDIPRSQQLNNFRSTDSSVFRRNIENMVALAKIRDIDVVLSTFTFSRTNLRYTKHLSYEAYATGIEQHNDAMREIAARYSLPLVDLANLFPDEQTQLFSGFVHLDSPGTEIKAQIFHDELIRNNVLDKHLHNKSPSKN